MFSLNVKLTKSKLLCFVLIAISVVLLIVSALNNNDTVLKDKGDREAYIMKLGYNISGGLETKRETSVPQKFPPSAKEYLKVQKNGGFDIESHKGEKVTIYSYCVTDFSSIGDVTLNLLVADNVLIGGDISSYENGGFTLPLTDKKTAEKEFKKYARKTG